MHIGEKLRSARLEAGLSQRALCGDTITRNMLSLIEHGSASPSMGTLKILAERLGKPVSFFLDEEGDVTPNRKRMEEAWLAFENGNARRGWEELEGYQSPDPIYDREHAILRGLLTLDLARDALREERTVYARKLLEEKMPLHQLEHTRLLLTGMLPDGEPASVVQLMGDMDEELLLRARAAVEERYFEKAAHLLEAMDEKNTPDWQLLRGDLYLREGDYRSAAACYHRAEEVYPDRTDEKLETCYRELGDFKLAYVYACRQKK